MFSLSPEKSLPMKRLDERAGQRAHDQRCFSGRIDVGSEDTLVAPTLEYVDEKIAEDAKELGDASHGIVRLLLLPEDQAQHEADRLHVLPHELIKQIDEAIDLAPIRRDHPTVRQH